ARRRRPLHARRPRRVARGARPGRLLHGRAAARRIRGLPRVASARGDAAEPPGPHRMLLNAIDDRRAVFVGGKGGVGKTSIASALALASARRGSRVLVVSTDPAHNLGHLWQRAVGDEVTTLWDGSGRVDGVEIDPARTVDAHLAAVSDTMTRLLPEHLHRAARDHLDSARDAPGTHESAVLERVAETLETGLDRYDLVIFDTAPSGHTLHLLAMPERMTGWTEKLL